MATNYRYSWDDEDLIKAYEVAVTLGTRTNWPRKEAEPTTSTSSNVVAAVEGGDNQAAENLGFHGLGEEVVDLAKLLKDTKVYTTYFDSGWVPCEEENEEGSNVILPGGESIYFAEAEEGYQEDPVVPAKGKGKKKKKGKQVQFTGTESGYQGRQSGWDKTEAEEYQEEAEWHEEEEVGGYYNPQPMQTPDWTGAFPQLTTPPLPSAIPAAFQKGDMSSLLMSWYLCGYHSGYFDATQEVKSQARRKK